MAKVSPDEQLALELVPIQEQMEKLEEEYDKAKAEIPDLTDKLRAAQKVVSEIADKLDPLRKQWDEKLENISEPWKTLLMNKRARKQVKTSDKETVAKWYRDTITAHGKPTDGGISIGKGELKKLFDKATGLGERFRPDLQPALTVDKDSNTVTLNK